MTDLWLNRIKLAVAALLFIGLVVVVRHQAVLSERSRQSAALLEVTRDSVRQFSKALDEAKKNIVSATSKVDTLWRVRTKIITVADSHRTSADSAFVLVPATDSLACKALWTAFAERTTECAHLRKVVKADSVVLIGVRDNLLVAAQQLVGFQQRVDDLNTKLGLVSRPFQCKILFFPCPSRTAMFFVGSVAGYVISKKVD